MASPSSPDDDLHSIANSTSSPHALPAWHFPFGPSSKYHQRERRSKAMPQHTRNNSSYTPRAPALATERRSHHRRALTSLPSPPSSSTSDYSQSPLSRFSIGETSNMAQHPLPSTPAKASRRRNSFQLRDSPFSDYFTDDARSFTHLDDIPSSATQQLLVRMNKLQSQLIRDTAATPCSPASSDKMQASHHPDEAIAIVGRHLTSLEHELCALTTQSRYAPELTDSGLFMEPGDYPRSSASSTSSASPDELQPSTTSSTSSLAVSHLRAERDYFLLETQRLLAGLRAAQAQLRHRYDELRALHDQQAAHAERLEGELATLGGENAALRADLAGDAGELLFLKLRLQRFETMLETSPRRRKLLLEEMERWWVDWREVEQRFRRRKEGYGVLASSGPGEKENGDEAEKERPLASWVLEMTKAVDGRVTSVTIKRLEHDSDDAEKKEEVAVTGMEMEYLDQGTQTDELQQPPAVELEELDEGASSDDCAITTSSEPSQPESDEEESDGETTVKKSPEKDEKQKTPWQELWDGLTMLANMDDSHF